MRTDQARTISIIEYLAREGHTPAHTRHNGREAWYRSPLRSDDDTASFKVDTLINKWFDHGLSEGGNTLDLVVLAVEWGSGRRKGWLSNLHLGARDPDTGGFVMLGKTFKGLTDETLEWQTKAFLERETHREGHVVHVRPEIVDEATASPA